jgi:SNW domain-containing protein 1
MPIEGDDNEEFPLPSDEEIQKITEETKHAIEKIVNIKLSASQPTAGIAKERETAYVKYTPSEQGLKYEEMPTERLIKVVQSHEDPLQPPKFKYRNEHRAPPTASAPVMHSPTRKVDPETQHEWIIPPCISNWKNPKGRTIALDKREAADGRGLREVVVNDNFARLADSLYIAERLAREEIEKRAAVQGRAIQAQQAEKEMQLRQLAAQSRLERIGGISKIVEKETLTLIKEENDDLENMNEKERKSKKHGDDDKRRKRYDDESDGEEERRRRRKERDHKDEEELNVTKEDRDVLRLQQQRQREKDYARSSKRRRVEDEDEERIILNSGTSSTAGGGHSIHVMYDERLFNKSEGLSSGYGDDEEYNVFTQPFRSSAASSVGTILQQRPVRVNQEGGNTYSGSKPEFKAVDFIKN